MLELLLFLLAIVIISAISWLEAKHKAKVREEIEEALESAGKPLFSLVDWVKNHLFR